MDAVLSFGVGSEFNQVGKESPFSSGGSGYFSDRSVGSSTNSSGVSTPDPICADFPSVDEMIKTAHLAVNGLDPLFPGKSAAVPAAQEFSLDPISLGAISDVDVANAAEFFMNGSSAPLSSEGIDAGQNVNPFKPLDFDLSAYLLDNSGVDEGPTLAELNFIPELPEDVWGPSLSSDEPTPPSPMKHSFSSGLFSEFDLAPLVDLTNSPQKPISGKIRSTPKKVREAKSRILEQIRDNYGDRSFKRGALQRSLRDDMDTRTFSSAFTKLTDSGAFSRNSGKQPEYTYNEPLN